MLIDPETYYDENLKGKNAEEIMTKIRSLKREIGCLKNIMEHPEYQCIMHPSEAVRICCNRLYLNRAKQALVEVGGTYIPSKAELKAEEFNANIPYISKVKFCIGGEFCGFETRTYTIDGDSIYMDVGHSLILKPSNLGEVEVEEMDKDSFLEGVADLHIGEWRKNYNPRRFGRAVLDGTQWHLYIYFSNGYRTVKIHGSNDYPYNFNRLTELFGLYEKWDEGGISILAPDSIVKYDFVNAHISNISFPKTIEQLEEFIYEHGCYNVEDVINEAADGYTIWTVPRSSVVGDVVLYFHAKTAIQWIRKLETATKLLDEEKHDKALLLEWLNRAREIYSLYGGKIFAIGRVSSRPEREDEVNPYHWSGRVFADIKNLYLLETPIDISEFNSFILVSRQSAITPLPSKEFEELKSIIKAKNPCIPLWFIESKIGDNKLSKVNKNNFLEITNSYRKRFPLEINFRSYYVDYFLETLSGKNVYMECQCHTIQTPLARVDNVFEFGGKKILLEVKLNIALEDDLISQLNQYIGADYICLSNDPNEHITDFEKKFMFVIDVYSVYKYEVNSGTVVKLFDLDDIKNKDDIVSQMMKSI